MSVLRAVSQMTQYTGSEVDQKADQKLSGTLATMLAFHELDDSVEWDRVDLLLKAKLSESERPSEEQRLRLKGETQQQRLVCS